MTIEAMKQALETLEQIADELFSPFNDPPIRDAILALRAALDTPGTDYERGFVDGMQEQMKRSVDRAVNAMCKKWVGLTDEEIDAFVWNMPYEPGQDEIRAIEAKLREKNS
jgi:hypothetical protein